MHSVSRLSAVRILVQRWRLAREKRGSAPRAFETRRLWQRVTAGIKPTVAFISAAAGGGLAMQVHADTVNALSVTGQTATTIGPTTNNITNITTTTKAGAMGFNAFSSFKIGTGNTVNLQLPDGTTHLINLVYDTTGIRIDGILNSVTSNKIGGHVVFANPFGMIVGSTGVLNVGSLTAIGVSSGTMDGVLSGALAATPNLAPAQALIDGTAPIVAGSVIRIDGRINALAKVKLAAGTVNVDGTIMASADARHEATFLAAVNTSGAAFDAATGFVEGAGGTIEIVGSGAGNTLNINGTLNAGSTNGGTITAQGSTINIGNADFLATTLNASGSTGTAGKINVGWTPGNLADKVTVLGEGMLLAHGNGATANGGTIDIWGTTTNEFHGLAAANGQNLGGTIRLGGGAIRVGGKVDAGGFKGGGSVSIGASATPGERANSVAVTQTGKIYADAVTSGNGGTISIYGNNSNDFRGLASAKGGSVSGTGAGGTIDISAPHGLYFGGSVDTSAALGAAGSLFMQTSEACLVNVATDSSCASTLVWSSLNAAAGSVVVSTGDLLRIGGNKNGTLSSVNANFTRGAGETMTFSGGSIVFNANSAIRSAGASVSMTAGSINMGNGTVSTNGGNVTMVASETITMGAGSMINTRKGVSDSQASLDTGVTATGASGNVTMNATLIDIGGNSTSRAGIYAQGDGTRLGGDISLIAFEKADPLSDLVSKIVDVQHAQARVEVSGAVKGKTINIGATALSIAGIVESVSTQTMLDEQGNQVLVEKDVNMSTSDILKDKATDILNDLPNKGVALLMNLLGVQGAAMVAEADAVVNINGTGLIKSDGDMTIRARAEQTANAKVELGTMFVNPGAAQTAVAAATVVGVTLGGSELNIKTGATLQSGGAMSLISRNDTNLLSVAKVTSFGTDGGVALAVGVSNTSATANVASGVSITAASLDFAAQQRASYEVEGTANAFGTGKVGIGVGVGVFNGSATATMGSNVNASLASGTGNVNLEASNLVTRNFVKGATSAGSGIVLRTLDKAVLSKVRNGIAAQKGAALNALGNIVTAGVDAVKSGLGYGSKTPAAPPPNTPPPPPPPSNTTIKLAAATAVNVTDLDANVTIADGVTINAKGEVGIVSIVEDKGIHNIASSAVESPPKGKETAANPGTDTGLSGGVAVGIYEHTATSHIGKNVTINAGKIGVHSEASAPLEITWLGSEWDSASDVWTFLKPKISGTLGVPEQVLTSFANATSGGNTLAVGGSVNIFDMENSATSWIGQGAVLNATSTSAGGFTHKLHQDVVYGANGIVVTSGGNPVYDTERSFVFNQGLTVDAVKLTEKASAAGNFSIFLGSTGAAKVGVGGSFNFNRESGTAAVVVDDNATLSSTNGNILLESQGYDRMYVVSPSSGRGTSIGGNILAAYTALDTNVITAVSNQATLKAKQVEVLASEKFNVWTAAGAVNISNDAAVGAAAAANRIGTRAESYIGDVGDLRGLVNETAGDSADATATVYANTLTVRAETSGTAGALAVAGAVVSQPPPSPPPPPGPPPPPAPPPAPGVGTGPDSTGGASTAAFEKLSTPSTGNPGGDSIIGIFLSKLQSNLSPSKLGEVAAGKYATEQAKQSPPPPAGTPPSSTPPASTPPPPPTFAFAAAGSVTINLADMDTKAEINGATIKGFTPAVAAAPGTPAVAASKTSTSVSAVNQTNLYSGSGAGALAKGGATSTTNVAIAGAVGLALEQNRTSASIIDSKIVNPGDTSVVALSAGQHIAVGLGLSFATGQQPNSSTAFAGNISVLVADNHTTAQVVDSTIGDSTATGTSAPAGGSVKVMALDSTDMGAGGLSLAFSNSNAIGLGATVLVASNDITARIAGSTILRPTDVSVAAFDPARMIAVGVTVNGTSGSSGVSAGGTGVATAIDNRTNATIGFSDGTGEDNAKTTISGGSGSVKVVASDSPSGDGYDSAAVNALLANAPKDATFEADSTKFTSGDMLKASGETSSDPLLAQVKVRDGSLQVAAAIQVSAATGSSPTYGFAAAVNSISTQRNAVIDGAVITKTGSVRVAAEDHSLQVAVAVGAAGGKGEMNGAGSIAGNVNLSEANARIGTVSGTTKTVDIDTTSNSSTIPAVAVEAFSNSEIWSVAGNLSVSTSGTAAGAAITFSEGGAKTTAAVRNANVNVNNTLASTLGGLRVKATTASDINSLAIAGGYASGTSLQGSFSWNSVTTGQYTRANIDKSSINASKLDVLAGDTSGSQILGMAGAFSISSGGTAVGAGIMLNDITSERTASILNSSINVGSGGATVEATNSADILGFAINFGASSGSAGAVSLTANTIENTTTARVANSTITSGVGGGLTVHADSDAEIYGAVLTIAVGSNNAVGGSLIANTIHNTTTAKVDTSAVLGMTGKTLGNVWVHSEDSSTIGFYLAAVAGGSNVAVGAGLGTNLVVNTTDAYIDTSTLLLGTESTATVEAKNDSKIYTEILSGAVSGANSVGGVLAVNNVANGTHAKVNASSITAGTTTAVDKVTISATDDSEINNVAMAIAVGGSGSLGAAIAFNRVGNDIEAGLYGNTAGTAKVLSDDVVVKADSKSIIRSLAAGIAADGQVGVGGSIAVNLVNTNVTGAIDKNARVVADNNVAVIAQSNDSITNGAGGVGVGIGAAGIGVAVSTNTITGTTEARVGGNDTGGLKTSIDALGKDATGVTVSNGLRSDGNDPGKMTAFAANDQTGLVGATIITGTKDVRGLAVNALSVRRVASGSVSAGVGQVGVSATLQASAIAGDTNAIITGASINQGSATGANADRAVDVLAASHTHSMAVTGTVGLGLYAGVGGAIDGQGFGVDTTAKIYNSNVNAGNVKVNALASDNAGQLDIGLGGGLVGVQGTGSIAVFRGTTAATLALGTTTAKDVLVNANHSANYAINTGAAAGGAVGIAGAFNVAVNEHHVLAQIGEDGDSANTGRTTTVTATAGDVAATATSRTNLQQWTASGAAGGIAGAITAAAGVMMDSATARISRATVTASGRARAESLVDTAIQQRGGAISIGSGGSVAGAVGIALARGQSLASIEYSTVTADGITASAVNKQDVDGIAIGGAVDAMGGVAGSVQLNMVGFGAPDSSDFDSSNFTKTSNFAKSDRLNDSGVNQQIANGTTPAPGQQAYSTADVNAATKSDFSGALTGGGAGNANATSAQITGSTLKAAAGADDDTTKGVNVSATSETAVRTISGAIAGGGLVGAAGSVGVTRVFNYTSAGIDRATSIAARTTGQAPDVRVNAVARDKAGSWAVVADAGPSQGHKTVVQYVAAGGVGGIGVSLAVGDVTVNNVVEAGLTSETLAADSVAVTARDESNAESTVFGVSIGAVSVGAASSVVRRTGDIFAGVLVGGETVAASLRKLSVDASEGGSLKSIVYAGSAGAGFAATGNGATVSDSRNVNAGLVSVGTVSNYFTASESVAVAATRAPELDVAVYGAAVSGIGGVAVSVATGTLAGGTNAYADVDSMMGGNGTYSFRASNQSLSGGNPNVDAFALAGAGGLIIGAAGSGVTVLDSSNVTAAIGAGSYIPNNDVTVFADNSFTSKSFAAAAAIGYVGIGLAVAETRATGNTTAEIGANVISSPTRTGYTNGYAGGLLDVRATGNRTTQAYAFGGAGGVIAGAGASANALQSGTNLAIIRGGTSDNQLAIYGDVINVLADQKAITGAATDSFQASALGASASVSRSVVNVNSQAEVGDYVRLTAHNIRIDSHQQIAQDLPSITYNGFGTIFSDNAGSAGYGIGTIAGADSLSTLNSTATTRIGKNVRMFAVGDPTSLTDPASIAIGAGNDAYISESVSISTGGLVSAPIARAVINLNQTTNIVVGDSAVLNSQGSLAIGTYSKSGANTSATVKVYGLAGLGETEAETNVTADQKIAIGSNANLFAWGDLTVMNGRGIDLADNNDHIATASSDAFSGFVGIGDQMARARYFGNMSVVLGAQNTAGTDMGAMTAGGNRAVITSNRSINVGSEEGFVGKNAMGSATSTLSSVFSSSQSDNQTPGSITSVINFNADLTAGNRNQQTVTVSANGTVTGPSDVAINTTTAGSAGAINPYQSLTAQIAALQARPDASSGAVQDDIEFLTLLRSQFTDTSVSSVNVGTTGFGAPTGFTNGTPTGMKYQLWASGGNVNVYAKTLSGTGSITAKGGARVDITNDSNLYLNIGSISIPDVGVGGTGGAVNFVGGAAKGSVVVSEVRKSDTPTVSINSSWGTQPAPWILVNGDINNLAGLVSINNDNGSIGLFRAVNAQSIDIRAPNGVVTLGSADTVTPVGGAPQTMWHNVEWLPTDGDLLASFAAQIALRDGLIVTAVGAAGANSYTGAGMWSLGDPDGVANSAQNWGRTTYQTSVVWYRGGQGTVIDPSQRTSGCNGFNNMWCIANGNTGTYDANKTTRVNRLGGDGLSQTKALESSSGPTSVGISAGTMALIQGSYINVAAPIKAGKAGNYSVRITNPTIILTSYGVPQYNGIGFATVTLADCMALESCRWGIADRGSDGLWRLKGNYNEAGNQYSGYRADYMPVVNAGDAPVSVAWNTITNGWQTDDVNGGGGGLVWLKGKIVSTRQAGNIGSITVNNGVSNITVVNEGAAALTVNNLNPGLGGVGVIRITDTNWTSGGNNLNTWYVSKPGEGIKRYESYTASSWQTAQLSTNSTATYDPKAGMRYTWSREVDVARSISAAGEPAYQVAALGTWNTAAAGWTSDTNVLDAGFYQGSTSSAAFEQSYSVRNLTREDDAWNYSYNQGCGAAPNDYCTQRYYVMPKSFTLRSTSSVKADYAINIGFGGNTTGTVNVQSNGGLIVKGNITNLYGNTTLASNNGGLSTGAGVTVQAKNLNLYAGNGTIGGAGAIVGGTGGLFNAVMADGGSLSAYASQGIRMRIDGGSTTLTGNGLRTNGNLFLSTNGSVFSGNGTTIQVQAKNIDLNSDTGGFGSLANPLRVDPLVTTTNGAPSGGVIKAHAQNGIYLDQANGDMRISTIESVAGDVWLRSNGSLYAVPNPSDLERSDAELAELWTRLALTGSAAAADATVKTLSPYERGVNMAYNDYWSLRDLAATFTNGSGTTHATITLNAKGLEAWAIRTQVAKGLTSTPTTAQINAYANEKLAEYENTFTGAYAGTTWRTDAKFTTQSASLGFVLDTTAGGKMTVGSVWTEDSLKNVINAAALGVGSGSIPTGPMTISGGKVTLIAGLDIGSLQPAHIINIPVGATSLVLTTADKAALARATAPGDIKIERTGDQITKISINQVRPIVIQSSQGLVIAPYTGKTVRDLFIQTDTGLNLEQIVLTGNAEIRAALGITTSTTGNNRTLDVGGDLVLDGGAGGLGSLAIPLTLRTGGNIKQASGGGAVYLRTLAGDNLKYGVINAGGLAWVHSGGSILSQILGTAPSIFGSSIDLQAAGSIGVNASNSIQFLIDEGGTVKAKAGTTLALKQKSRSGSGSATVIKLLDADGGVADYRSVDGGNITVDGIAESSQNLVLITEGDIAYTTNARSNAGGVAYFAGDSFLMDAGATISAISNVTINAAGLKTASSAGGSVRLSSVIGDQVSVNAKYGTITGVGSTATNVMANGATGGIYLNDGQTDFGKGIGAAGSALRVSGANLNATTATGDLRVAVVGGTASQTLQALTGQVDLSATGTLDMNQVIAGNGGVKVVTTSGDIIATEASGTTSAFLATGNDGAVRVSRVVGPMGVTTNGGAVVLGEVIASNGGFSASATNTGGVGFEVTTLTAKTGATISSAGALRVVNGTVSNGNFQATATGAGSVSGSLAVAAGSVKLSGKSWSLGNVTGSGSFDIDALSGGVDYKSLVSGGTLDVDATGVIKGTLGQLAKGTTVWIHGSAAQLGNVQSTVGGIDLKGSGGDATAGTVTSAGAVKMYATGDTKATSLTGTSADLHADRNLTVTTANVGSFIGTSILDATVGTLTSGGAIDITSQDRSVTLTNGSGTRATLVAGTSMTVNNLVTTGDIGFTAPAGITTGSITSTGGAVTMLATGTPSSQGVISGTLLSSAKTVNVTGTSLNFSNGTIESKGLDSDIYLTATGTGGGITYGKLDAVRDLFVQAMGGVSGVGAVNAMIAGRNIVGSAASFNGYRIKAPGTITLSVPVSGNITYEVIEGTLANATPVPPPPTTTPPPPTTTPPPPTTTPPPPPAQPPVSTPPPPPPKRR